MRTTLFWFVVGVVSLAGTLAIVSAQQGTPDATVEFTMPPSIGFGIKPGATSPPDILYQPVIGLLEGMQPPHNATLIATIEAQCASGPKNCKTTIQFWQIGQ